MYKGLHTGFGRETGTGEDEVSLNGFRCVIHHFESKLGVRWTKVKGARKVTRQDEENMSFELRLTKLSRRLKVSNSSRLLLNPVWLKKISGPKIGDCTLHSV